MHSPMHSLLQDVQYAARLLRKAPAFSLAAIFVLALGIGANTAVFSVVNAVLLRPLPFPHAEQLMRVGVANSGDPQDPGSFGDADFLAWRDRQKSFAHVAAIDRETFTYSDGGPPQRIRGAWVSQQFFDVLGVRPLLGRTFQPEEDRAGASLVVIGRQFWQTQLNSDSSIIGRSIMLNGRPFTVTGIMPAAVRFPSNNEPTDVWPLKIFETPRGRPPYYLVGIGRLRPGVNPQQASAELTSIYATVTRQFPNSPKGSGLMTPLREMFVRRARTMLWVLLGAVGFVLLIAMVNIANLLLARATSREREIGIRLALGASRTRLVRQLLTESILLAALGGIAGVLLAIWAVHAFVAFGVADIPRSSEVSVDSSVLLFVASLTLLSGILFGLAPALQSGGASLHETLKQAMRGSTGGSGQLTRRVLVITEFAFALMLMVGAALLIRSFVLLEDVNPGFNPSNLLTAEVELPSALYQREPDIINFWDNFSQRLNATPGIQSATVTLSMPPNQLALTNPFIIEGQPYDPKRPLPLAEETTVSGNYFQTLGIPLIAGRTFGGSDGTAGHEVLIVNKSMADRHFPGQNPVGKRLQTGEPDSKSPWETIIGVVGDAKYSGLDSAPTPQLYVPYNERGWASFSRAMFVIARTNGDPLSVVPAVRSQLAALDRNLPLADVVTMEQRVGTSLDQQRFRTLVLGAFAGLALLLASFGIYAVIAYFVEQRTREIGIRVALGATRVDIMKLVVRQALTMSALGAGFGIAGALILTRAIRSLLFAVSPSDPLSFAGTTILLITVAIVASYVPAIRATKVDPLVALRYE
jgi:putative ABC transport system permease protein